MAKSKKIEALEPEPAAPVAVTKTPTKPKRKKQPAADPAPDMDGWFDVPPQAAPVQPAPEPRRREAVTPELGAPTAKPSKRKATAKTLATIFAGYLQALDERGGSTGTIVSYRAELETAGKALGTDTPVSLLSDAQVAAYFESDPVTKKRNGKPKSPLSIDKTRRVLRQALVWAGHTDLVPTAVAR